MNIDFVELKKEFINKKVADSGQFLDNVMYNFTTLEFSKNLILSLINEYKEKVTYYHEKINNDLIANGEAKIDFLDDSKEICGLNVNIPFLISKNIKDVIQYANNILDSLAQLVNCALISQQHSRDRVDFQYLYQKRQGEVCTKLNDITCKNVKLEFTKIYENELFDYLRKANNRIKHIMDIGVDIRYSLFENNTTQIINSFKKSGNNFSSQKIEDKCIEIYEFIKNSITNVSSAILLDLQKVSFPYRYNVVKTYGQITKAEDKKVEELTYDDADFLIAYVEVEESDISKIPKQLELICAIIKKDGTMVIFNYDYDYILLKVNDKYLGYAVATEPIESNMIYYRKYNIIIDNGEKFNEILEKRERMRYYPYASDGEIVIIK